MGASIRSLSLYVILLVLVVPSNAYSLSVLESGGEKVVLDENTGKYWFWDLEAFVNQTYYEQQASIAALNDPGSGYFGMNGWHMATREDMEQLATYSMLEIHNAFNDTRERHNPYGAYPRDYWYYFARYDEVRVLQYDWNVFETVVSYTFWYHTEITDYMYELDTNYHTMDDIRYEDRGAWVVTSAPVPEPATMLLLGTGLVGLGAFRRKFRK